MKWIKASAFIVILSLTACISAPKTIQIVSDPVGAEVFLLDKNGTQTKLGETPLSINEAQIRGFQSDFVAFRFQKEGYEVERVYIDMPSRNIEGNLTVKLKDSTDWTQAFVDKKASKYLDDVAGMTAEIQGALAAKDLSKGEAKARAMVNRYPNLAVGWSLLGNVLFIQNRRSEALEAYNRALGIDPSSQETRNVIERIKGM